MITKLSKLIMLKSVYISFKQLYSNVLLQCSINILANCTPTILKVYVNVAKSGTSNLTHTKINVRACEPDVRESKQTSLYTYRKL